MPQIPRFRGQQVAQGNLPGPQVTTGMSPQALGSGVGLVLNDVVQNAIYQADVTAATNAVSAYRSAASAQLDGDGGMAHMRGQDLFQAASSRPGELSKLRGQLTEGLSGRQRLMAAQDFDAIETRYNERLQSHVGRARVEFHAEALETEQASLLQEVSSYAVTAAKSGDLDVGYVAGNLQRQDEADAIFADANGGLIAGDKELWLESRRLARHTETHAAVLDAILVAGNDQLASDYLGLFGPRMEASERLRYEQAVGEANRIGTADRGAAEIVASYPVEYGAQAEAVATAAGREYRTHGQQLAAALAEADALYADDPAMRKQVKSGIKAEFDENANVERLRQADEWQRLDNRLQSEGDLQTIQMDPGYQTLDSEYRDSLLKRWDSMRSGGTSSEAAYREYHRLQDLQAKDPEAFKRVNLGAAVELAPWMRDDLAGVQENPELSEGARTVTAVVNGYVLQAFPKAKPGNDDGAKSLKLRTEIDQMIRAAQDPSAGGKGRKLVGVEVDELIAPLFAKTVLNESGINELVAPVSFPDIPAWFTLEQVNAAAELGEQLTAAQLEASWAIYSRSGVALPAQVDLEARKAAKMEERRLRIQRAFAGFDDR